MQDDELSIHYLLYKYTVLTKSKLTPRKGQITYILYVRANLFVDQCIYIGVSHILRRRQIFRPSHYFLNRDFVREGLDLDFVSL